MKGTIMYLCPGSSRSIGPDQPECPRSQRNQRSCETKTVMRINSPRETTSCEMENYLANASIRTSVGLDWGSLVVRTRSEPARCRYLHLPATPDPWLVLTTGGGPRKTEVRG